MKDIIALIYALITSTIFIFLYIKTYSKYFNFRKNYRIGCLFFLLSVYIQFLASFLKINIDILALISFISYPLSLALIFKTNPFNTIFLALNAILKIYAAFVLFGAIFATIKGVQYSPYWLNSSYFYNLSQGSAYLLSIGSMSLTDRFLIKDKLKYFFQLKRNLVLLLLIQIILIINIGWLSVSTNELPFKWYNVILISVAFSFDIIYFLLRLFTANSSYYSTYKTHTHTLKKQLEFQLDHYKTYESQMNAFLKFKHDYDKVLHGISNLLAINDYNAVKDVVNDSKSELLTLNLNYRKYSNNIILDALLNDYSKRFESIGANFDCFINLTIKDITELHLIKLFYNILENIYEALLLIKNVTDRKVIIKSDLINNYLKISFINSMNELTYNHKTTKIDKLNHGFGIQIIEEILSEYDAFSNRYTFNEDELYYYYLEIFLPIK